MKKILSLSLIWLAVSLLSLMENSWIDNGLATPGRIDVYCSEGVIEQEDLAIISNRNPDLLFAAAAESVGIISAGTEYPVDVLAVSDGYDRLNPVRIVRGSFCLKNAVLIRRDLAYEIFNSDEVAGGTVFFNNEAHLIAGIFELPPFISGVSSMMPDVIASIEDLSLNIERIQMFQMDSGLPEDGLLVNSFIRDTGCTKLKLNSRYSFFCQLKKMIYISIVILIIASLVKILKKDFSARRELFRINIRKYYFAEAITNVLKTEPLIFIIPVLLIPLLLCFFGFTPYLPPEVIDSLTPGGVVFWPLKFIISINDNINPVIILPGLFEAAAFIVLFILFLPGYIVICRIKSFSIADVLIIPPVNILFTLLFIFLKLEPVFDFKINLLLLIHIAVSASVRIYEQKCQVRCFPQCG